MTSYYRPIDKDGRPLPVGANVEIQPVAADRGRAGYGGQIRGKELPKSTSEVNNCLLMWYFGGWYYHTYKVVFIDEHFTVVVVYFCDLHYEVAHIPVRIYCLL